ncbi:MAG: calcium/sodium antiporter [Gemmatimonadetes bacterium]|nr:calcium/sodium antiporter [Gemmatimonadota bacterium]
MSIITATGMVVLGIALLTFGGELLVKGAIELARLAKVRPAVIGLTIVAFGTSMPEMAVSIFAAVGGNPDVALGNVVGSNILNVAVIVGLSALITTLPVHGNAVRLEWPFMFLASLLALGFGLLGHVNQIQGIFLVLLLIGFNWYIVTKARPDVLGGSREALASGVSHIVRATLTPGVLINLWWLTMGIVVLVIGGRILVTGAVELALLARVSDRIIGLTIVAIGTSLPELVTSLVAARKGHGELAVANVIGSNIFNILGVLGVVAIISPIRVSGAIELDMVWMLIFTIALFPMMLNFRVSRREGAILLGGYLVYLFWLLR